MVIMNMMRTVPNTISGGTDMILPRAREDSCIIGR